MSDHLIIPDPHATPGVNNKRAEWLGRYINDTKPDTVVILGDLWDFSSLASFDKGKKSFQGKNYRDDVDAGLDFNERLLHTVRKAKKKLPRRVFLVGNHEQRIDRAIDLQPELEGTITYEDLHLDRYFDEVVHYTGNTPGTIEIDSITYAHYLVSGVAGRPISGEHQAYSLLSKKYGSCTVGHTHTLDYSVKTKANGKKIMGLVAGVFSEYSPNYAGNSAELWWRGIVHCRNVDNGVYDPTFISLNSLKMEYGRV